MIPIAMPLLAEEEADAAREAVLSGWVSQGPQVAAFEREFAALVGAPYACAVSNCTTALHLALMRAGYRSGRRGDHGQPFLHRDSQLHRYCGATPVFVDIDPDTYNIDPDRVAEAITPRTRAIIAVHQMGMPCDLAALAAMADRHGIVLIEDAACAAGSEIRMNGDWERIGKPHGRIACFSFHPRKVITTGEGGMLTTADPELDRKFRLLRQHGMSVPDTVRHGSPQVIFEDYLDGRLQLPDDRHPGRGRAQAARAAARARGAPSGARRRATRSCSAISKGCGLPSSRTGLAPTGRAIACACRTGSISEAVMQSLLDQGIATRRGIMCSHREAPYAGEKQRHDLRESELAQDHAILLPIYAQMSEDDQTRVATALRAELSR